MTLHVVKTDVLLWVLGGFAEPPVEPENPIALPLAYVREIKKLVECGRRLRRGEVQALAERYGGSSTSISSLVSKYRRLRQMPSYWQDAA